MLIYKICCGLLGIFLFECCRRVVFVFGWRGFLILKVKLFNLELYYVSLEFYRMISNGCIDFRIVVFFLMVLNLELFLFLLVIIILGLFGCL